MARIGIFRVTTYLQPTFAPGIGSRVSTPREPVRWFIREAEVVAQ